MAAESEVAPEVLARLQGVWFPTHKSVDGVVLAASDPVWPPPCEPWLMTVAGDTWHVTSDADWYHTGGRLRVDPAAGRLTFEYPEVPEEYDFRCAYRLAGDELLLTSDGSSWFDPHDRVTATRAVRVAIRPTPAMAALIVAIARGWLTAPWGCRPGWEASVAGLDELGAVEPDAAPGRGGVS